MYRDRSSVFGYSINFPILRRLLVNRFNWNVTTEGIVMILKPFFAFESCLQESQRYLFDPVKSSTLK